MSPSLLELIRKLPPHLQRVFLDAPNLIGSSYDSFQFPTPHAHPISRRFSCESCRLFQVAQSSSSLHTLENSCPQVRERTPSGCTAFLPRLRHLVRESEEEVRESEEEVSS